MRLSRTPFRFRQASRPLSIFAALRCSKRRKKANGQPWPGSRHSGAGNRWAFSSATLPGQQRTGQRSPAEEAVGNALTDRRSNRIGMPSAPTARPRTNPPLAVRIPTNRSEIRPIGIRHVIGRPGQRASAQRPARRGSRAGRGGPRLRRTPTRRPVRTAIRSPRRHPSKECPPEARTATCCGQGITYKRRQGQIWPYLA